MEGRTNCTGYLDHSHGVGRVVADNSMSTVVEYMIFFRLLTHLMRIKDSISLQLERCSIHQALCVGRTKKICVRLVHQVNNPHLVWSVSAAGAGSVPALMEGRHISSRRSSPYIGVGSWSNLWLRFETATCRYGKSAGGQDHGPIIASFYGSHACMRGGVVHYATDTSCAAGTCA